MARLQVSFFYGARKRAKATSQVKKRRRKGRNFFFFVIFFLAYARLPEAKKEGIEWRDIFLFKLVRSF